MLLGNTLPDYMRPLTSAGHMVGALLMARWRIIDPTTAGYGDGGGAVVFDGLIRRP